MSELWVDFSKSPLAIETKRPQFSWRVMLDGRCRSQSAYQILVSTNDQKLELGKTDLWDSGKVASAQSTHIEYQGNELGSNSEIFWSVQIWDENGVGQGFSQPESFGTGLYDNKDWKASWVGMGPMQEPKLDPYSISQSDATSGLQLSEEDYLKMPAEVQEIEPELRSPMLRKEFVLKGKVSRARAYVCGLGLFEFRMNGKKVGDDVLNTPRTDFDKRVTYFTYNIEENLLQGDNTVGIILGGGWYNAQKKFWHWQAPWFGSPRAIVQIEVEYADGSEETVVSDASWQGDWSPIMMSCIYDGEDYDARLEQRGWDEPGFEAKDWNGVNLVSAPKGTLSPLQHQPNRVMERWEPKSVDEPEPGVYVFDMGKVMTGWSAINIPQGMEGETVTLKHSELLYDTGMIAPERSCGKSRQAEHYIMRGEADERYEPRFTYHGFRYVEVRGFPGKPTLRTLQACFVHQGVEEAGRFECENELINHIHSCTLQSQRCNLQMGVPTDDTQREERLGWSGDAWSYAEESFYNLDVARFWSKWIDDCCDQQDEEHGAVGYITPLSGWGEDLVWSAAFVLIPWWHYQHYGDKRILKNSYPQLKKYIEYLEKTGKCELPDLTKGKPGDFLFPKIPLDKRYASAKEKGYLQNSLFGDHLATHEGGSGMGKDQPRSMATAFYHMDVMTMAQVAEVLGEEEDVQKYIQLGEKIKSSFNEKFYDGEGQYYDVGCQSAQALALCFNLVPEEERGRVQGYLNSSVNFRQGRISSGYAGTKWVINSIAHAGREDIVWSRAKSKDYPSWGYMLAANDEEGIRADVSTTIAENWKGNASRCHTTLGAAIDEWFYWGLAGIRPDPSGPGYEKIILHPYLPKDLPWAKASLKTLRGTIVSEWEHDGEIATWKVSVPANCSATVFIPTSEHGSIKEGGQVITEVKGIVALTSKDGEKGYRVGSGRYTFSWMF